MKNKNIALWTLCFFCFLTCPVASSADPSPTSNYLLNTPVDWMTFGLFRLNKYLDENTNSRPWIKRERIPGVFPYFEATASYNFSENKISVQGQYLMLVESPSTDFINEHCGTNRKEVEHRRPCSKEEAEHDCRSTVEQLKGDLGVDKGGAPLVGTTSSLNSYFGPENWEDRKRPKNWRADIDQITEVAVHVAAIDPKEKKSFLVICKSKLLEPNIYFSALQRVGS